jgi:hypothetical protein
MQFQLLPAFLIFLGSYAPLAIILAIQDIPNTWWAKPVCRWAQLSSGDCTFVPFDHPWLSIASISVTGLAVLLAWTSLRTVSFPFSVDVRRAKATPNEIINYTFPYVVSFMGISYGDNQKLLGFIVFLLWMFAITYKSGQILMNPLLLILRWRLYEATILINGVEKDVRVLARGQLVPGKTQAQTIQDFYVIVS